MFVLSAIVAVVPAVLACALPGSSAPIDLLAGAPVGPDGRAHLLTADAETVCWWTVDEDGDAEVHRVWPLPGPHAVGVVVLEDGMVLLAIRAGTRWGLLRVDPRGEETAIAVPGIGELRGLRGEGRQVVLEWLEEGRRRVVAVDADAARVVGCVTADGSPDAP